MVDNPGETIGQIQKFLRWASKKIDIHFLEKPELYAYEREVWWASFGENVGFEMNGKNWHFERPVVIVKKFSKDMIFVLPTTTKIKKGSWFYDIEYTGKRTQVVFAQARTISTKRLIRKIGILPDEQFRPLLESFINLIKTDSPTFVGESSESLARPI